MRSWYHEYGDLSKPSCGPRGRQYLQTKWRELSELLNSDGTGDSRPEDKWRKVWSDYKNNCKKKLAKINRAVVGTGGGPACMTFLNDLESRVMQIIGVQAATGMEILEAGFPEQEGQGQEIENVHLFEPIDEDCNNTPETSSQVATASTVTHSMVPPLEKEAGETGSSEKSPMEHWQPPPKKKSRKDNVASMFIESEKQARNDAKERDRMYHELETERLRQRDMELQLQLQWLEFMKEAMNIIWGHGSAPPRQVAKRKGTTYLFSKCFVVFLDPHRFGFRCTR